LNDNMLSDGSNTFSWNAQPGAPLNSVSLQYDGFGRRTKNTQNTSFLFDGANAVQELSGSTATANLISGGIDEVFTRSDVTGSFTQLKDALGSTIDLVDASGNLTTQYFYDPFGNTSGASSSNRLQYTGRENEANGLYYYRGRYYDPPIGRFISEDPIGFAGSGPNFYAYVFDDPINLIDPFGLDAWDWLQHAGDFSNGAASVLTFGLTDKINDALGNSQYVDKCSGWHTLGTVAGIGLSTAIGGAAGAEAAEANAAEEGFEFSHWIPNRMGGPRSIFNGNYVSQGFHYLTDPFRYPSGWQALGPKLPAVAQQLLRIPWVYDGAAAGAALGGAGAMAGRSCKCH
jgi:RHS repeat-associated protein